METTVVYDDRLINTVGVYKSYINNKFRLIKQQEELCHKVSNDIGKSNSSFIFRLYTMNYERKFEKYSELRENLKKLKENYEFINAVTMNVAQQEITEIWNNYNSTVKSLLDDSSIFLNTESSDEKKLIFDPIHVELLQGNSYRPFNQLSFGQKSGIILMISLNTTTAPIIVIDQPEDNLDTYSIINIIAPTLIELSKNKSIILATHNSHLVMGLPRSHLIVMESLGDYGRIKTYGSLFKREVVRQMLMVLEGGEASFAQRIKLYEDFATLLQGSGIRDIDVSLIESSFRRRTIDNLRNFLQPVISDRSLLDFLRHELRQRESDGVTKNLSDITMMSDTSNDLTVQYNNLSSSVDQTLKNLDIHISKLLDSIEQIRLMDTNPHPSTFDLYSVIDNEFSRLNRPDVVFSLSSKMKLVKVYADQEHIRLVFRNLLTNAIRATERKEAKYLISNENYEYKQSICIEIKEMSALSVTLQFFDNGIGISSDISKALYKERCSDREGADHGLGGVIIKKLLDLNNGFVSIDETSQNFMNSGTKQSITLRSCDNE